MTSPILDYVPPFVAQGFAQASQTRWSWESLWRDCYAYALPVRSDFSGESSGQRRGEQLYDATALDAVDQLASLILGYLTPPLSPWFAITAGTDLSDDEAQKISGALEKTTRVMQAHFDQSNFLLEAHQCFLDLVVAGTACLILDEERPGEATALRFSALSLQKVYLGEDERGALSKVYRLAELSVPDIARIYGASAAFSYLESISPRDSEFKRRIIDVVLPDSERGDFRFLAYDEDSGVVVYDARGRSSPYINFRWMKSPGESYGRSPVMKALPDIKTANTVVELILKNASIAVTGLWQAEDDGVINPATIELVPGAIIPKAIGSKGLTPLEMPARFDVSQLVLDDLRARIRHALLVDRFPVIGSKTSTATEILERSSQMALLLGAMFGRLQVEFLGPLIKRAHTILRRRGAVPDLPLDGRTLAIDYRSPLARAQSGQHVQTMLGWVQSASLLGPDAAALIDAPAVLDYLTRVLGVPSSLVRPVSHPNDSSPTTFKGDN